ncbi:poly(A)-specific ribonuclease PNLDC1 isoform X2 [Emydura macquarii macquarii]|uniref:poly(A)-specific ribonuclease PNLDC1 isoform X2 n=1 Tax=Emydura macquarii macquarii TaxID=1129001 RepID=UPI00352A603E
MELGAAQFAQSLTRLRELVLGCDFLGLDMEFTGLHSVFPQGKQPSLFDSPAEWYLKARQSVQQFTVNQLGLSIFLNEKSNKYVAHSYNFFLFPTTFGVMDSEFSLQASSIQFLTHYGFDHNKFLKDGIPYMNEVQKKKLQQSLLAGNWKVRSTLDKDKVKKAIDDVTCWLPSAEEGDSMVLHDMSGFQIFEVQLILRQALPDVWTVPFGDQKVIVKKVSRRHRWHLENSSSDCCRKDLILLSAQGFTNLFESLVEAKKPVVGHNMLMDLLHLHDKFYKPLPESYEEFKRNIHRLFPVLIDTKNVTKSIWKEFQFPRASDLLGVYEILCSDLNPTKPMCPVIAHASDCSKYADKKFPHEAAYDAFLCGSVLLKIAHLLLGRMPRDTLETDPSFSRYLRVLTKYLNQNFSGTDVPSQRPPLLIASVQGWPGVDEEQIYQELKVLCRFDVRRLTKNQFLLLANKFKDVRIVLRDYKAHPNLQISLYHHWRHSPQVNCLLQIAGIVASWSLLAFVCGGSSWYAM